MTQGIERVPPNGEQHIDDSDVVTQEWVVEGLVVAVEKGTPKYVVTEVLSGGEKILDTYHPPLRSATSSLILSPEDLTRYPYRGLVEDYYRRAKDDDYDLDRLLTPPIDIDIDVGDRLRIVRWSQREPYKGDAWVGLSGAWSINSFETITVLEKGINVQDEESHVLQRKQYIRENLAGIIRRLERLELDQCERLENDREVLITWEYKENRDYHRAQFTYGDGPIKDHFVTVKAKPYTSQDEVPLGGDIRFTQNGQSFLARHISAGETSKELALIDEPLVEVTATVWTETAFNPEVDNVCVGFVIDGVRYNGLVDVEISTRSFRNPGHHIEFSSFVKAGEEYDGIEILPDESDAIIEYKRIIHKLSIRAINIGLNAKMTQNELGNSATSGVLEVQSLRRELEVAGENALRDVQPVISQVTSRPSDIKLGLGGKLLVPRSKLDSIRIVMGSESNRTP